MAMMRTQSVTFFRGPEGVGGGGTAEPAAAPAAAAPAETPPADSALTPPPNLLSEAKGPSEPAATDATAEPKEGDPKEGEKAAPESYTDFTLPEGLIIDTEALDQFKGIAKELNLSQDAAQKLVDFQGGRIKDMLEAPYKVWHDTQRQWTAEVMADPEIGGAKWDANAAAVARVFEPGPSNPLVKTAAEGAALRQALNTTGAGNNPSVVRLFVRLGLALQEPAFVSGRAPSGDSDVAAKFFPSMTNK